MGNERAVFVRADLRPAANGPIIFSLNWTTDVAPNAPTPPVPSSALSPNVSAVQKQRRALQERASTGWNHWARRSQLAQIALPQHVGVELSIRNASGATYAKALPEPQKTQVRMGPHAYDGSFSSISLVPFPDSALADRANITVETAHVPDSMMQSKWTDPGSAIGDAVMVVTSNSSTNLSLVVDPQAFWGATATITAVNAADLGVTNSIALSCGDLGTLTVSVTGGTLLFVRSQDRLVTAEPANRNPDTAADPRPQLVATFRGAGEPLVVSLSFSGKQYSATEAKAAIDHQRAATERDLADGVKVGGGLAEAYEAMATVIAWNVNYDPRVAVTCPVSRTFEPQFDFIFFGTLVRFAYL